MAGERHGHGMLCVNRPLYGREAMAKDVPEYGAEEDVWTYEKKVAINCRIQ